MATALLTWEFSEDDGRTLLRLTDQVTSLVGQGMVDGHRNGHTKAMDQLDIFLSRQ